MIALGIDPGQIGGLAVIKRLPAAACTLVSAIPMPLSLDDTTKPRLDIKAVKIWLRTIPHIFSRMDMGVIEKVHSMPRQGVASSFQFGRMFGAAELLPVLFCYDNFSVTPRQWKKHFGLSADKREAVKLATSFYGDQFWLLKKHEGIAEAALIATWALETQEKDNEGI